MPTRMSMLYLRLLLEIFAMTAVAEVLVMLVLPHLVGDVGSTAAGILDAAILAFLVSPLILWRILQLRRRGDGGTQLLGSRRIVLITGAVLVVGLLFTAYGSKLLNDRIQSEGQASYDRLNDRLTAEIQKRFSLPVYGLRALAAMIAAEGGHVFDAAHLRRYVAERGLDRDFPGVRGFGFIKTKTAKPN